MAIRHSIKKVNRKRKLSLEDRVNAEFKHMKLRIKRLEQLVLSSHNDNGSILEKPNKLKKG